ncbi:NAD(P)-dependent oxidoreductase [Nocardia cyriacigeorgica]|uniref:NAD(P)-dependent oxidoreductase n=1 Tax=Nocardia cyriacigeorgica TaxID=135487 RepID=UPI000565B3CC|nr:NAD(P)H-binding protein [Nocardia cyriacigeorgica]MBF6322630.1 NAD(P)H-binding protein [Nocardia cyriacigeorgica]MBF6495509.1 NAD(P)H-binding protein [Nocardia cyriacigeorgica]TLF61421.1 NAD-dependent epimerase/dehydratase family protein [Nocardia cyriacigeorgica]
MRITVLGATGGVGRHLVGQAVADGHEVTAVVRNPDRLPHERDDRLRVVRGNALSAESLTDAVAGADAVLSGIGANGRRDPLRPASTSATAVADAMRAAGVRRLVVVSAGTLNRSGAGQPLGVRAVSVPLRALLKDLYADLERMEAILADSGLDWTSVRPSRLTDAPGTGRIRRIVDGGPAGLSIPRADVARAMLDVVPDASTVGRVVGVSS